MEKLISLETLPSVEVDSKKTILCDSTCAITVVISD